MALQALELKEPIDEDQRCTLLLALDEVQWKAREHAQALNTFQWAAGIAKRHGLAEELAQAALGLEEAGRRFSLPEESRVRLLEEALGVLEEEDSVLKTSVMGGLARALYTVGERSRSKGLSQPAVEMARWIGNASALLTALRESASLFATSRRRSRNDLSPRAK